MDAFETDNILIVDDNENNLLALENALIDLNCGIIRATSGNDALREVIRHDFALILLDVQMPDMSGFEVAELLRGTKKSRHIPIIFVTAMSTQPRAVFKGYEMGAVDYLFKPIDPIILKSKARVFLELSQQRQMLEQKMGELEAEITRREETERQLLDARDAAEAASRAKANFLAMMSHEIRTPINVVIGMTELLGDTDLDTRQQEFVQTIRSSGHMLTAIISDILDFSRIESGRLSLDMQPVVVHHLLEEIVDLFSQKASQKNIELNYVVDDNVPAAILSDPSRLRQILINLVGNAVKFTETGGIMVEASLASSHPTETVEIQFSVRDTGIGIPPEKQERLFEPFAQADSSTTRRFGGTGLGLAICRRLADMLGGRIWLESQPDVGSTFFVTIRSEVATSETSVYAAHEQTLVAGKRIGVLVTESSLRRVLLQKLGNWDITAISLSTQNLSDDLTNLTAPLDMILFDHQPDLPKRVEQIRRNLLEMELEIPPFVLLATLKQIGQLPPHLNDVFADIIQKPLRNTRLLAGLARVIRMSDRTLQTAIAQMETAAAVPEKTDDAKPIATRLPLTILVAEDMPSNQKMAVLLFEKLGYDVEVVSNGREVMEVLQRKDVDIIFMDIQMPEMDGLEATQQIVENWPHHRRPKIVAMTANATAEDRRNCLAAGMDDYISKPIQSKDIEAVLQRIMTRPDPETAKAGLTESTVLVEITANLRKMMGSTTESREELIQLFANDFTGKIPQLQTALEQQDAEKVRFALHSLAGICSNFGAVGLKKTCESLKESFKQGDPIDPQTTIATLESMFLQTKAELAQQLLKK